jgi:RNase P subunit RPR2
MRYPKEEERHYPAGCYVCPVKNLTVELEADVPRPWIEWPMTVRCKACGEEHRLEYDDVLAHEPAFGHE